MGKIVYDGATGKLVGSLVWQFDLVHSMLFSQASVWAESGNLHSDSEDLHECPLSKRHVTGCRYPRLAIDLMGEGELCDFVPVPQGVMPIICEAFADRLQASGLTGFVAGPVIEIDYFQAILHPGKNLTAENCNNPRLLHLDFRGKGGCSSRLKVYEIGRAHV